MQRFIVWNPRKFSRLYNVTPLVLELSFIRSHLLWGEFSAFSAANTIHNFSNFRSTRYPSLLGGQRRYGMKGCCPTPLYTRSACCVVYWGSGYQITLVWCLLTCHLDSLIISFTLSISWCISSGSMFSFEVWSATGPSLSSQDYSQYSSNACNFSILHPLSYFLSPFHVCLLSAVANRMLSHLSIY